MLLAGAYTLGAGFLGRRLGVEPWLMITSGLALALGGGVELGLLRRRRIGTYMRLMVGYDTGWVVVTAVALLLAGRDSPAAGELWIGYQTAGPLVFAALLTMSKPRQPGGVAA